MPSRRNRRGSPLRRRHGRENGWNRRWAANHALKMIPTGRFCCQRWLSTSAADLRKTLCIAPNSRLRWLETWWETAFISTANIASRNLPPHVEKQRPQSISHLAVDGASEGTGEGSPVGSTDVGAVEAGTGEGTLVGTRVAASIGTAVGAGVGNVGSCVRTVVAEPVGSRVGWLVGELEVKTVVGVKVVGMIVVGVWVDSVAVDGVGVDGVAVDQEGVAVVGDDVLGIAVLGTTVLGVAVLHAQTSRNAALVHAPLPTEHLKPWSRIDHHDGQGM